MNRATCEHCEQHADDGECLRYGKPAAKVHACGLANRDFNRRPFSRNGAERRRRQHEERKSE
jgi:hypothetical protein